MVLAIPDTCREREGGQVVPLAGQRDQPGLLAWAGFAVAGGAVVWCLAALRRWRWRVGRAMGAVALRPGATGHSSSDPAAEPGDGGERGEGQAEQPQEQAADDGHGGGLVVGQGLAGVAGAGDGPGADDADEGVGGQGVDGRRHDPDGQVTPARGGGERVHAPG